jgi:threonine synthase
MHILVSSNLERLVYLATGRNGDRVKSLMQDLSEKGVYSLNKEERVFMDEFIGF